jgi:hypothetical protein
MPFNPAPTGYFPSADVSSSGIFIPYIDFESYSVDTSGDIRQLVYSFNKQVSDIYESLTNENRSNEMTVSSSQGFITNDTVRKNFNLSFNLAFSGIYSVIE